MCYRNHLRSHACQRANRRVTSSRPFIRAQRYVNPPARPYLPKNSQECLLAYASITAKGASAKDCGGSQICEHDRIRNTCKECLGSSACPYKRIKATCKYSGCSQICQHNRIRSKRKESLGSTIYPHKRVKSKCKDCRHSAPY